MIIPAVACSSLLRVCSITARPCPSPDALAVALNSHCLSYDACIYLLDPAWRQFNQTRLSNSQPAAAAAGTAHSGTQDRSDHSLPD